MLMSVHDAEGAPAGRVRLLGLLVAVMYGMQMGAAGEALGQSPFCAEPPTPRC
jgi:hypothetical protein